MRAFIISLFFTLAAGFSWISSTQVADAQSAGFPSKPTFQKVTVRTPSVTDVFVNTSGGTANNRVFRLRNNGAGSFQVGALNDALSTGNNFLTAQVSGTTPTVDQVTLAGTRIDATGAFYTVGQVNFTTGITGYNEFVNRSGSANGFKWYTGANGTGNTMTLTTAGVLSVNSIVVPKIAMGYFTGGGGANCNASGSASNNYMSCSRAGAGQYNLTFSAGFNAAPPCTVTTYNSNTFAQYDISSSTAGSVVVRDRATGTLTDANISVICVGNG